MSDKKFSTGAVRSADADKFSFTSLPMIGLLALARTAGEGAEKYGRFNYLQGMPLHNLLEHVFKHLVMFNAGDRSETHLAHAAWGLLSAIQEEVLRPEAHVPHMLGPGCSITPAIQAHMDEQKPILAANRAERGPEAFTWNIFDLPDVQKLRGQRDAVNATFAQLKSNADEQRDVTDEVRDTPKPKGDPFKETIKEWCERNPMSSALISADSIGLSRTGCPEPFDTTPVKTATRTESHVPVTAKNPLKPYGEGEILYFGSKPTPDNPAKYKVRDDHMGGCPPLP